MKQRRRFRLAAIAAAMAVGAMEGRSARAYDAATTHAGLTEQAVLTSTLHRVLTARLGRSLGLFEPLQLHSRLLPGELRRTLWERFAALDPEGGYRPTADGSARAMSWVVAGSVLTKVPAERGRHHFLDPSRGTGLDDKGGLAGVAHSVRLAADRGGTLRQIATGTAFDGTGRPALAWVKSPQNDLGLPAFEAQLVAAVAAAEPAERESALVRALLSLGGILGVLEDLGEPAHVRNDFREAFLQRQGSSSWDKGSSFELFVAERFGRIGVPRPEKAIVRPTFDSYFTSRDGGGLADRTHRAFFSTGTLPSDLAVDPDMTPQELAQAARDTLAYERPSVPRLELRTPGRQYLRVEGRRALAYERGPARVRFFLDDAVYRDSARALLPEIGGFAAGLVDHLFRVALKLEPVSGEGTAGASVRISAEGLSGPLEATVRIFAEDAGGRRRAVGPGSALTRDGISVAVPPGTRRIGVVVQGRDDRGGFVAVGESAAAPAP